MREDSDGIIRQEWRPQTLAHNPTVSVRAGPAMTEDTIDDERESDDLIKRADEPDAVASEEQHIADRWFDLLADDDGHIDAEATAYGLAVLDLGYAKRLDAAAVAARARVAVHRRALARIRASLDAERKSHRAAAAEAATRIEKLEKQIAEDREATATLRKSLAAVELGVARDRSLRRLTEARRQYPAAQRADLERARRATDRALNEGTRQ